MGFGYFCLARLRRSVKAAEALTPSSLALAATDHSALTSAVVRTKERSSFLSAVGAGVARDPRGPSGTTAERVTTPRYRTDIFTWVRNRLAEQISLRCRDGMFHSPLRCLRNRHHWQRQSDCSNSDDRRAAYRDCLREHGSLLKCRPFHFRPSLKFCSSPRGDNVTAGRAERGPLSQRALHIDGYSKMRRTIL
jgi:hypothetical protein